VENPLPDLELTAKIPIGEGCFHRPLKHPLSLLRAYPISEHQAPHGPKWLILVVDAAVVTNQSLSAFPVE
jgi:hypothetical protein